MGYPSYDLTIQQALGRQQSWSEKVFGPGMRTKGIIDHIHKELAEVRHSNGSAKEWIDVLVLTLDALWRTGADPADIESMLSGKIADNAGREWPDWRNRSEDEAIEHVRTPGEQRRKEDELSDRADSVDRLSRSAIRDLTDQVAALTAKVKDQARVEEMLRGVIEAARAVVNDSCTTAGTVSPYDPSQGA